MVRLQSGLIVVEYEVRLAQQSQRIGENRMASES
jgi:hypothetical protein